MWKRTWGISEGIMICGGLVFIGLILHLCTGGLDWGSFAWPLNVYLAIVYVAVL